MEEVRNETDDEWEEETLAVVELNGLTEDYNDIVGKLKFIGIESDTPMLQLDQFIFNGQYEDVPGTMLLMEMKEKEQTEGIVPSISNSQGPDEQLALIGHTYKKLTMTRAFLTERDKKTSSADKAPDTADVEDTANVEDTADVEDTAVQGSEDVKGSEDAEVPQKEEAATIDSAPVL